MNKSRGFRFKNIGENGNFTLGNKIARNLIIYNNKNKIMVFL